MISSSKKIKPKQVFRHLKYSKYLITLLHIFVTPIILKLFNVSTNNDKMTNVYSPVILLPNHSSVIDPIVYSCFIRYPLYFIVSDTHFRNPFFRVLVMRRFGCISKKKNQQDHRAIKRIMHVLQEKKQSICIFPEGVNTWDGVSNPIIESTASLIKLAKVPVIVAQAHGAYLTWPRWSTHIRRGKVHLTFKKVLDANSIEELNKKKIFKILCKELAHNEFTAQEHSPITFVSSRRAEYVERVLYACPHCTRTQTIVSHKQFFSCTSCNYTWFMTQEGFFYKKYLLTNNKERKIETKTIKDSKRIDYNINTWNTWQNAFIITILRKKSSSEIIFYDEDCILRSGVTRLVLTEGKGRLSMTKKHLFFMPYDSQYTEQRFLIANLIGVNVQNNEKLEWTLGKLVYQIKPANPRINTYKYMKVIEIIQGKKIKI